MAYYDDEIWDDYFDRVPPGFGREPRPIETVELPEHDQPPRKLSETAEQYADRLKESTSEDTA